MRDYWKVKEVIEANTDRTLRLYWYRGKPCRRVQLDSQLARQLAGYILIEKDLRSARIWLEEIQTLRGGDTNLTRSHHAQDRQRYNLVKGLFVAALTFYGKAFAQCEGRRVKLERKQLAADFHELHDDAISYRNNFAAHSGAKLLERVEIAIVYPPKMKKGASPRIYTELTQPDLYSASPGEKGFEDLIDHVRFVVKDKIGQLSDKLFDEHVAPLGYQRGSE